MPISEKIAPTPKDQFQELIDNLAKHSHGSKEFTQLRGFISKLKKTEKIEEVLFQKFSTEPIRWENVSSIVWDTKKEREYNSFHFLQGDVIRTRSVEALSVARSDNNHDLWIVLSPDCHIMSKGEEWIHVAPLFSLPQKENCSDQEKATWKVAISLRNYRAFPHPKLESDGNGIRGYFADMGRPYFIHRENVPLATPCSSLTLNGWHILNGFLQERYTRSQNIEEAIKLRTPYQK